MFERYTEKARRVIFFARYDVRWNYAPHSGPIPLQEVILTLEPIAPENPPPYKWCTAQNRSPGLSLIVGRL